MKLAHRQFTAAMASLAIVSACSLNSSPSSVSTPTGCQSRSPSPNSGFATYSINRITFQYPTSWRLQPAYPGGSIFWLYSPDYKDSGGAEIQTVQQGARLVFSQTDLPRMDVTADNYPTSNLAGYLSGKVIVINCRKAFQVHQSNAPWWDSTSTVFFRDDGTEVEVDIDYPIGMPATNAAEYGRLLSSLVYQ